MDNFQDAKSLVLNAGAALDIAKPGGSATALTPHVSLDYLWRGMHPFHESHGVDAVAERFWDPLKTAMGPLKRRRDIFFAGRNQLDDFQSIWVVEMGHFMGLWDSSWIGMSPSKKLAFLRYCEFHKVEKGKIVETANYVDILNLADQTGRMPINDVTGLSIMTPGPSTHDGLLYQVTPETEGLITLALISDMVKDLRTNEIASPESHMARFWSPDMAWFGPGGIGASGFFEGYRRGHAGPFEEGLEYVRHTEHVARLGEGNFGGFFGYPSLTVKSKSFLGLPPSAIPADMRIVDLYRREGDKLAENWIFIDLLHFYMMQGVDLLSKIK